MRGSAAIAAPSHANEAASVFLLAAHFLMDVGWRALRPDPWRLLLVAAGRTTGQSMEVQMRKPPILTWIIAPNIYLHTYVTYIYIYIHI